MRNFILLAMSTLHEQININSFKTPEGTYITDCQSQLEPVVRYIISKCSSQEVYIFSMTTNETVELKHIGAEEVNDVEKGKRIRKVSKPVGDGTDLSAVTFFEERIRNSPESKCASECIFDRSRIELSNPEEAIKTAADRIREYQAKKTDEPVQLWVDTHGGIRDVSLLTNIVAFLLDKFTNINIAGIYGTEYSDETKEQRIIDQLNAFESLSFVSGMSDFMHFGNVDVLKEYYESKSSGGTKEIQELIAAMKLISDGTQFCDPYLYTKGLDSLGEVIKEIEGESFNSKNALLPIFYTTIREDYKKLLDPDKRTSLDIIKRCLEKKQYQQALTFIEALMPEYFFEKKILYFDGDDIKIAEKAAEGYFKSPIGNAFDSFNEKMKNCFKDDSDIRNSLYVRARILSQHSDISQALEEFPELSACAGKAELEEGMKKDLPIKRKVIVGSYKESENNDEKKDGTIDGISSGSKKKLKILFKTQVLPDEYEKVGRIMRMHNVLKSSRNKFNHAVSSDSGKKLKDKRPELADVIKIIELYVKDIQSIHCISEGDEAEHVN